MVARKSNHKFPNMKQQNANRFKRDKVNFLYFHSAFVLIL